MDLGGLTHECLRQRFGFDAGMVSAKLPKEQDKKSELRWQKKKSKKFSIFADFRIIGGGILISHAVALAGLFYLYALDTDISFKPSAIISVVLGFVNMFGITVCMYIVNSVLFSSNHHFCTLVYVSSCRLVTIAFGRIDHTKQYLVSGIS